MKLHLTLALVALSAPLAAAAETGIAVPARFAGDRSGAPLAADALVRWWQSLNDPELNRLIGTAIDLNRDLTVAQARVAEAQARRRAAAGEMWPQLGAEVGATRNQFSQLTRQGRLSGGSSPDNNFSGVATASWEIDVFQRLRQGVRAAQAEAEATEEARRDVMVLLLSEVAATYVELRGLQAEQGVVEENIRSQDETARLTRTRRDAGVDNDLAVAQSEGQLASTRATLPPIVQRIRETMHRLATLTGQPPATYLQRLAAPAPLPRVPRQIPAGLPSELLARRPDVRQAERLLAASVALLGQAKATRLPRFSLTASTGQESREIGDLVEGKANLWSFGAFMTVPLFTGGTLRENVRAAEAAVNQSRATYDQSMLLALEEVENSLVRYAETQKRLAALRDAETQARRTLALSTDLYKNGAGSFLNVLDAQRSLLLAQGQAVAAERQVVLNLVGLYKALGGGWDTPIPSGPPATGKQPPRPSQGDSPKTEPASKR